MMEIKGDLYLVTYEYTDHMCRTYTNKKLIAGTRENLYRYIVKDVLNNNTEGNRVTEVKVFSEEDEAFHQVQLISDKLFQELFLAERMSAKKEKENLARVKDLEADIENKRKKLSKLESEIRHTSSDSSLTGWENVSGPITEMGD